jgi:hypothetical protein
LILEHRKSQGALMTKAKSISLLDRDFISEVKVESYFKQIFLRDIEFERDYVSEKSFLNLVIIEKLLKLINELNRHFIQLIVSDDLNFVERVIVYNYKELITIEIRSQTTIINPYSRKFMNCECKLNFMIKIIIMINILKLFLNDFL